MADNEYSTVVKITTEGDASGAEKVKAALESLKTGAKETSDSLAGTGKSVGAQAKAAEDAAGRVASASAKASGEVEKFSKSCQTSTKQVISNIGQWVTGFGAFEIVNKLWGAFKILKEKADEAREAAVKAATEIEKANGAAAVQRVKDMAEAQRGVAEAIASQAQHARELNQARAAAEDSAYGQQIAQLDMEEQEALSQLDPGDAAGRARISYGYSTRRRQMQYDRSEKVAARKLADAQAEEDTAGRLLGQKRSDYSANSEGAAQTLAEIADVKKLIETLNAPEFKEVTSMIGGAMVKNRVQMLPTVETLAARAAAETRLERLNERYAEQAGMADASARAIPGLETAHQAAVIRSGTAAGELAALRDTAPKLNVALARSEYKGVVEAERKAEDARAKKEAAAAEKARDIADKEARARAAQQTAEDARVRLDGLRSESDREGADVTRVQRRIDSVRERYKGSRNTRKRDRELAPLEADLTRETDEARAANRALAAAVPELSKVINENLALAKRLIEEVRKVKSQQKSAVIDTGNID